MFEILDAALSGMTAGPRKLLRALEYASEEAPEGDSFSQERLLSALLSAGSGDDMLSLLRRKLAKWDNDAGDWASDTPINTRERRTKIYELLGLDHSWKELCDERLPFQPLARSTVISADHTRWYNPEIKASRSYYFTKYTEQLASQGWPENSILQLDNSTDSIVERLADPTARAAYQSKGLVIGYVQSGKTANFTGVIAKAADAGYRLIIVLGGMLDVLRAQTQRRIDKELVGRELLFREYVDDPDWEEFLKHGTKPSELGAFDFTRLTGPADDYQRLTLGVEALKFEAQNTTLPFNHQDNLHGAPVRIAVLKKNSRVMQRLLRDLTSLQRHNIGSPLDQVPTLIIDDESDQASINTKRQTPGSEEEERNATNQAIVDLLRLLPRAQYVGYTATPFANVFVDPASEADIFPKDFLVALPRPIGYMGVSDFYDFDAGEHDPKPNKQNFVREVVGPDNKDENLRKAIDSYILSGAIKLWRSYHSPSYNFRHHTMLVHVSQRVADQTTLATEVRKMYGSAGYDAGKGLDRLALLFARDFAEVNKRVGNDLPFPGRFEELEEALGDCIQRVGEAETAVLEVNNENRDQTPDFDKQSVWKILVGGTKLSRGYTVEGLTVSYYRRRAGAGDTLMQMGRWFGFRRGYSDLVRLFIGTEERIGSGSRTINLYEAFGGVCRDEEMFRNDLDRYASMEEPRITPARIPPLVPQHDLRPTAANKMRNAIIKFRNFGGQLAESTFAPSDDQAIVQNNMLLLEMLSESQIECRSLEAVARGTLRKLDANVAVFSSERLLTFLKAYRWFDPKGRVAAIGHPLKLQIEFLEGKAGDHGITDWLLLGPKVTPNRGTHEVKGASFDVVYRSRRAQQEHRFNTYNDPGHRAFAEHISGQKVLPQANAELTELRSPNRGVMIYYPITEEQGGKRVKPATGPFTVGFTLLFPENNIVSPLGFTVRISNKPEEAVVELTN